MDKITLIVKDTLTNLKKAQVPASPNNYHKEFCKVAKSYDLKFEECFQFKTLVEQLNADEQKEIKNNNVETIEDLIPILLKRIATKNAKTLSSLLTGAMTPSIQVTIDDKLAKFSLTIGNSPELIFEEDIQKEMQKFITKRFEADKKVVKQKTEDIAKLVTLMGQYLNDAIHSSAEGSNSVSSIKDELALIQIDSDDGLSEIQTRLITAAISIENEMTEVGKKLFTGKSQVAELEDKVKSLEEELDDTKKKSDKDHLTGLYTRGAFEKEAKILENNYLKKGNQYAVVFFDLDHFKKVNDTYGHEGGDMVLSTFAKVIQSQTREMDRIGRYGGEEFLAIINYKNTKELISYLKRIKSISSNNDFLYNNEKIHVTFSAGVTLRSDHKTYESALQKADVLLYEAKNGGRDKIVLEDGSAI